MPRGKRQEESSHHYLDHAGVRDRPRVVPTPARRPRPRSGDGRGRVRCIAEYRRRRPLHPLTELGFRPVRRCRHDRCPNTDVVWIRQHDYSDNHRYAHTVARPRRIDEAAEWLRELLPGDWTVTVARPSKNRSFLRLESRSGTVVDVDVEVLKDASPRAVASLEAPDSPTLAVADWISPRAREVLRSGRMSYLDATGNAEIRLDEPAVFIRTTGTDRNPNPKPAPGPRLRGPKAWALLRTLAEVPPPFGVRELAEAVDVDPGYVSRVLRALEDEMLITRKPRGPVTDVEWEGLIRKATSTYSVFDSNETSMWVATSGPTRFIEDVAGKRIGDWAVTGSVAAVRLAPVAGAGSRYLHGRP